MPDAESFRTIDGRDARFIGIPSGERKLQLSLSLQETGMVLTALSSLHNSLVARLSLNEVGIVEGLTSTIAEELQFELAKTKALMDKVNTASWS
jgi:hypothetical protein